MSSLAALTPETLERIRSRQRRRVRHPVRRTLLYVALAASAVVMVGPLYWMFATSFKPASDVFASPPKWIPDPWTLQNYRDVFSLLPFERYLFNSVLVTTIIVCLNVVLDTAAAYAFAKLRFPGRDILFYALLLTLMVPFQVNLIPLYRIMVFLHDVNPHLGVDTYFALIAPGAIQVFGIFLMRQYLRSIPDELLESARVDGASEFRILQDDRVPAGQAGDGHAGDLHLPRRVERFPVAADRDQLRRHAHAARRPGLAVAPQHGELGAHHGGHDGGRRADDPRVPGVPAAVHRGPHRRGGEGLSGPAPQRVPQLTIAAPNASSVSAIRPPSTG